MKKYLKLFACLVLVIPVAVVLAACGGGNGKALAGTYKFQGLTVKGQTFVLADFDFDEVELKYCAEYCIEAGLPLCDEGEYCLDETYPIAIMKPEAVTGKLDEITLTDAEKAEFAVAATGYVFWELEDVVYYADIVHANLETMISWVEEWEVPAVVKQAVIGILEDIDAGLLDIYEHETEIRALITAAFNSAFAGTAGDALVRVELQYVIEMYITYYSVDFTLVHKGKKSFIGEEQWGTYSVSGTTVTFISPEERYCYECLWCEEGVGTTCENPYEYAETLVFTWDKNKGTLTWNIGDEDGYVFEMKLVFAK